MKRYASFAMAVFALFFFFSSKPSYGYKSIYDTQKVCRVAGCGKRPISYDWNTRYCMEHSRETHYCRYPGCMAEIPNTSSRERCYKHN